MNNQENCNVSGSDDTYFFDIPLSDIYGTGCSALNLLYHGNEHGAFSTPHKKAIDLSHERAIQITLSHRSSRALSDEFDYSLVYYQNDIADHLWNNAFRSHDSPLKKMTRRVSLNKEAELSPHRLRHWYLKSGHPIYIAKYGHVVPREESVPASYRQEFKERFEGFLMRMPKGFGLRFHLFKLQHLVLDECRDTNTNYADAPHVMTYVREDEKIDHVGSRLVKNGSVYVCLR